MAFSFSKNTTIYDLSLTFSTDLPGTWPGQHEYEHVRWKYFNSEKEPYQTNYFTMDEHCGTHCDAPVHFIPPPDSGLPCAGEAGLVSGERLNLSRMQGALAVIDVRALNADAVPGMSPWIEPSMIQSWEKQYGGLQPDTIVVFQTGWDRYYVAGEEGCRYLEGPVRNGTTPGWPAPSVESLRYLYQRGIQCLGIDSPSMGAVHNGVEPHRYGLSRGMIYIEGLANLDSVPPAGCFFVFLPLKIAQSSGCVGRAVALSS